MAVTLVRDGTRSTIRLEGAQDVSTAAELRQALLAALEAGNGIDVWLEKVTELDVTAVQLLWQARREALEAGLEFAYVGKEPEEVGHTLEEAGLSLVEHSMTAE